MSAYTYSDRLDNSRQETFMQIHIFMRKENEI